MKRVCLSVLASLSAFASVQATDLHLKVESAGSSSISATPGATVTYAVVGTLGDSLSDGLAMFSLDLALSGGTLAQAAAPTSNPMQNFAGPLGVTNPAGFGGTVVNGALAQVGGAQNTMNSTFAPVPTGSVLTGVAQPANPAVLVTGTFTAPTQVGTYTLSVGSVFANVLRAGQTGVPFWKVDPATTGTLTQLTIEVGAISPSLAVVSVTAGQSQVMTIDAGPQNAGRTYWMLGTLSGTSPGTPLPGGLTLPLNNDGYFQFTRMTPNSAFLSNSLGTLDGQGRATVTFTPNRRFIGEAVHHAFMLRGPIDFVSEAEPCTVVN